LEQYFSRPDQFKTRNTHTDVRLALGWLAVLVSVGTGLYGWKTEFETAKPVVWAGVIAYFLLTSAQTAYSYYVEGKTVFVGKRKTLANRIETERVTLASETSPAPSPSSSPLYSLTLTYVRSSNGGKTLITRNQLAQQKEYVSLFDAEGTLDELALIAWLRELSSAALIADTTSTSALIDTTRT